jgi:hypothetical protein
MELPNAAGDRRLHESKPGLGRMECHSIEDEHFSESSWQGGYWSKYLKGHSFDANNW